MRGQQREREGQKGQMACYVSWRRPQMFTSGGGENVTGHLEALLCEANGSEAKLS